MTIRYIRGVKSLVSITRDAQGIPTIQADGIHDAYYALGYVHAKDRILLMEYSRALANGTISEIEKMGGAEWDKLAKVVGFGFMADELIKTLPAQYKEYIDSYVAGINSYRLENQYYLLNRSLYKRQLWTASDVLAILIMYDWTNAFLQNKELVFDLPEKFNTAAYKELFPEQFTVFYNPDDKHLVDMLLRIKNMVRDRAGSFNNGFAIATQAGDDSGIILGVSLESSASIYPKWYPVNMIVSGKRIETMSVAGLPFFFSGKN